MKALLVIAASVFVLGVPASWASGFQPPHNPGQPGCKTESENDVCYSGPRVCVQKTYTFDGVTFTDVRHPGPWHAAHVWIPRGYTYCATSSAKPASTAGGFLSYGTPDVYPYAAEVQGRQLMADGYRTPFCSATPNPFTVDSYGSFHLWGVVPPGEKVAGVLTDSSGTGFWQGSSADELAKSPGFCWLTS